MGTVISWLVANWDVSLGLLTALVAVAGLVTKLTPSKKDDAVVGVVRQVLDTILRLTGPGKAPQAITVLPPKGEPPLLEERPLVAPEDPPAPKE